jgi:hypothetical protein
MPRRKSLVTVIRDLVREQVQEAIQGLLGNTGRKKAASGRRRRREARAVYESLLKDAADEETKALLTQKPAATGAAPEHGEQRSR